MFLRNGDAKKSTQGDIYEKSLDKVLHRFSNML